MGENFRFGRVVEKTEKDGTQMYDVIVIGAGPAGCTAAKILAEKGHKVLLVEKFKIELVCGHHHLVGVDDDHVVAAVEVGREARFVFAAKNLCDLRAETAQNLVRGIDDHPFLLYRLRSE